VVLGLSSVASRLGFASREWHRVQPEEPLHKNRRKLNTAGRLRVLSFCTPLTGDFGDRRVSNA